MKLLIYKFYEKILFFLILFIFICQFFYSENQTDTRSTVKEPSRQFDVSHEGDKTWLKFMYGTKLLPGQNLYYRKSDIDDWSSAKIESIKLSRRSEVEFLVGNNKIVEGSLIADCIFPLDWRRSGESIGLRQNRETTFVNMKDVVSIFAEQAILLSLPQGVVDWDTVEVSLYQRIVDFGNKTENADKTRWLGKRSDSNGSGYDLFTPPIIYIHDGKLTARLPEKAPAAIKEEPFGVSLVKATKSLYSLKLSSWVGDTPYFEDLHSPLSPDSDSFTRNRLEIGKIYKRSKSRKPGQPSLIECEESDSEKLVKLEHFVVQQHKNTDTGGVRLVGRALVKDYDLGIDAFEINSLMSQVFAGDLVFEFEFSLPGASPAGFKFNSRELNKEFIFAGRKYIVSRIDLEGNTIEITKKDPRFPEDVLKEYSF